MSSGFSPEAIPYKRSVSIKVGQMAFTLILWEASSSARDWVNPITANLEAQ